MGSRLLAALRALDSRQQRAGAAAVALLASMVLPWYEKSVFVRGAFATDTVSAFGTFSFVEAAILLVAAGVVVLLLARGEGRGFHLPGGDGSVVAAAGMWAALLLTWRVFDRPEAQGAGATVGIEWGLLVAFAAAGMLTLAGLGLRAADRPEPPLVQDDETAWTEVVPRRPRRPPGRRPVDEVRFDDETVPLPDEPPEPPELRPRPRRPAPPDG